MNKKLLIFLSLMIFVLSFTIYEAVKLDQKFADASSQTTGTVIKKLPDVTFTSYEKEGKIYDPRMLTAQGKHIVVHFWATWCAPCEAEFPELIELIELVKDKKNIIFLLVAVNDERKKMKKFLSQFDLDKGNVVILEDNTDAHKQYGTYKMPETFVFNDQNLISKKFTGQQPWTQKYLVDYFLDL